MIKIVETNKANATYSFYETNAKQFVKNTADNRAKALFCLVLENYRKMVEKPKEAILAGKFGNLLMDNQVNRNLDQNDIDEFVEDLQEIFPMVHLEYNEEEILEKLSEAVLLDQQNPETKFTEEKIKDLVDSISEEELEEL